MLPKVTVIIPARNEEQHIAACLDSIVRYPDTLEVLVIDGMSEDDTRSIVAQYCEQYPFIRLLQNHYRAVPHAMNIGIREASGNTIVRMDAHATYPPDYLSTLIHWMDKLNADNVGGVWRTRPGCDSVHAKIVATVLSHPFGVGNATYRLTAGKTDPIEVDTVPFGCYRRDTLLRLGLYDERFLRNQDDELNARLKQSGGRIFLIPDLVIDYYARERLRKMALMLYQYGYYKPAIALKLGHPATLRQLAPPLFAAAAITAPFALFSPLFWPSAIAVAGHSALNLYVSIKLAEHSRHVPLLFTAFLTAHLSYGIGYLRGLVHFLTSRRDKPIIDSR